MGPRRGAWLHPVGVATTGGRGHAAAPIHPAARRPAHLPVTPTPSPRAPSVTWRRAAPARCGGAAALHKMSALGAVEAGTGTGAALFRPLDAEDGEQRPAEIESLCMKCHRNVRPRGVAVLWGRRVPLPAPRLTVPRRRA